MDRETLDRVRAWRTRGAVPVDGALLGDLVDEIDRLRAVEAENDALRRVIDDHCGCLGSGARGI